jgi:glyoxylase-like metal-dependent hydrolase (beta-lactamase superfamily II)
MTKLFEDVYYYRHPIGANCNVYVFKDGLDLDVVDPGISRFGIIRNVWKGMLKDGLDPHHVRSIYHTHAHFDHVQADCIFQQKSHYSANPIPVYVPSLDLFRMKPSYNLLETNFGELHNHFPKFSFYHVRKLIYEMQFTLKPFMHYNIPQNIHSLENGQKITLGKRTGIVYSTGGHTEGHSFIYIPDDINFLLTGDHDALNEFTCNWQHTLESVRLAEKINPDNIGIGHNKARLGNKEAMNFVLSYFNQFDKLFGKLLPHFHKGRTINLTHIAHAELGWISKIGMADLWAHMGIYAICKYFEQLHLGTMDLKPPFVLTFTITEDPENIDLQRIIRYGENS